MDRNLLWRRLAYVLVAVGIITVLYHGSKKTSFSHTFVSKTGHEAPQFTKDHEFDALTDQQCLDTFPDLYFEIDRAVEYWQKRGHTITANDSEVSWRKWDKKPMGNGSGGAMRVLIHDNELRLLQSEGSIGHWGYRGRAMGFLYLLQRAIDSATAAGENLPTIEAALMFEDIVDLPNGEEGTHSFWTWTSHIDDRTHDRHWLIPNYDLWYGAPMGSFREARRRAVERDAPFTEKIPKLVWRGSGFLNPVIRNKLVTVTKDKDWSDVYIADWGGLDSDKYLTIEDMCNYAMVVHTEGVSYSGRLSYLTNCDSLLFFHDLEWRTFTTHLLNPEGPRQNYIKLGRDWEDLEQNVEYYLDHPDEAEQIIENSLATFRNKYLTRPAVSCYIRQLIKAYATVSETPEVHRRKKKHEQGSYRRGISFERFLDKPSDGDFETQEWY